MKGVCSVWCNSTLNTDYYYHYYFLLLLLRFMYIMFSQNVFNETSVLNRMFSICEYSQTYFNFAHLRFTCNTFGIIIMK